MHCALNSSILLMKRDCGGQKTGNYGLYTLKRPPKWARQTRAQPSFGMTPTKTLRSVFL